jgi:dTDP-4-dehydrorhamnose reductase
MRVVLTGASGQLGGYLLGALSSRGHEVCAWSSGLSGGGGVGGGEWIGVDLTDAGATSRGLEEVDPGVIVHAAAVSRADEAHRDPGRARGVNVEATRRLADWCRARGRRLVFTSTDLVFDGSRAWNREDDPAEPILEYGRTKRAAEAAVLATPRGLVARLSLLYGPSRGGRPGFFDASVMAIGRGEPRTFFEDEFRTSLDLATAAEVLTRLAGSEARGLVHVAGPERLSRFALMRRVVDALGMDTALVRANRRADAPSAEPRPADVSLDTERLISLCPDLRRPSVEEAVTGRGA